MTFTRKTRVFQIEIIFSMRCIRLSMFGAAKVNFSFTNRSEGTQIRVVQLEQFLILNVLPEPKHYRYHWPVLVSGNECDRVKTIKKLTGLIQ